MENIRSRYFPYDKSIVINALYDTIEALGLHLDSSNSVRGTLVVSEARHTGSMRIALNTEGSADYIRVDIFPEDPDQDLTEKWSPIILDELSGTIQRAFQRGENG
ncbi:MAG: hypothetical protein ACOX1A_05965 [Saccharofermentanales bacterium]|jgi:hypothetical protein|nr:hypothetical protein [Clostridiaceae bacterium]